MKKYKTIRISGLGVPHDYKTSLVPLIINHLGHRIEWTSPIRADLIIYGSFYNPNKPRFRWLPRAWRNKTVDLVNIIERQLSSRKIPPISLFHTAENIRYNHMQADFAISHDLYINSEKHFRFPYWMEIVDWSHEGLKGNQNPRYGQLLNLNRLQKPLGDQFLKRTQKAVLITSHLNEPRASCMRALQKLVKVDGFGPFFDRNIKNHHSSNFFKKDILEKYAFNLCPENGIHPGYATEKIPEAFSAGCLPISYICREKLDFNSKSFLNLFEIFNEENEIKEVINSKFMLESFASEPLLLQKPSIIGFIGFLDKITKASLS